MPISAVSRECVGAFVGGRVRLAVREGRPVGRAGDCGGGKAGLRRPSARLSSCLKGIPWAPIPPLRGFAQALGTRSLLKGAGVGVCPTTAAKLKPEARQARDELPRVCEPAHQR